MNLGIIININKHKNHIKNFKKLNDISKFILFRGNVTKFWAPIETRNKLQKSMNFEMSFDFLKFLMWFLCLFMFMIIPKFT